MKIQEHRLKTTFCFLCKEQSMNYAVYHCILWSSYFNAFLVRHNLICFQKYCLCCLLDFPCHSWLLCFIWQELVLGFWCFGLGFYLLGFFGWGVEFGGFFNSFFLVPRNHLSVITETKWALQWNSERPMCFSCGGLWQWKMESIF